MKKEFLSGAVIAAAFIAFTTPGYAGLSLGGQASGNGSLGVGGGAGIGLGVGVPPVGISAGVQAQEDADARARAESRTEAQVDAQADIAANARARSSEKFESGAVIHGGTIDTNTTVTTETRESIDAGRSHAKKHRARNPAPPQREIHDHSTGLQNRADAGAGAVGGVTVNSNAAFSMGARQKTDFNQ